MRMFRPEWQLEIGYVVNATLAFRLVWAGTVKWRPATASPYLNLSVSSYTEEILVHAELTPVANAN